MHNTIILSESKIISGAEIVLKDYLLETNYLKRIFLLIPDNSRVFNFYHEAGVKKIYTSKLLFWAPPYLSLFLKPFQSLLLAFKLIPVIKRQKIDCILTNNSLDILYLPFIKLFFPNIRVYSYIHDMINPSFTNKKIFHLFSRYIIEKYIAVSSAVFQRLLTLSIKDQKVELIFNGLKKNNEKPRYFSEPLNFLFVGRMEDRKNPIEFVYFLKYLQKEGISYKGTIVYTEMEKSILGNVQKTIQEEKLDIALLKELPRDEVMGLMRSADFLVCTSKRDPLPTVVLEAMNVGTPVIGRNADGIPDMVENNFNGFLYDSIYSVVVKIKQLKPEEYYKMSKNSLFTIKNKFSISEKTERLNKLLFN